MNRRIVIFSAFLTPFRSGAEACAEEVALRLCDRFDITIITAKLRGDLPRRDVLSPSPCGTERGPGGEVGRGVPVIRVGFGIPFDKWLYPFLAPFAARKLKPDVLHAVLETFAGAALHMCTLVVPHAKQILTLQTTNRNFLRHHIMRTPDVITAISKVLADQAAKLGRRDAIVIPNGIPYDEIRKVCGEVKKVPGRILFVGRLEKMKGVDTLLAAFVSVHDQHPSATLHIVGSGSLFGDLRRKYGNVPHVTFCGALTGQSVYQEYAEAEIFCALSRSEALGNVFIEAQAAGCAVLGTEIGGIPEVVHDGVTGLLTEPDNPELTAGVLGMFLEDEKFRTQLADAAVEHARKFDWDGIAERYAALY